MTENSPSASPAADSQGHLTWMSALHGLDAVTATLRDALAANGISAEQYHRVLGLLAVAKSTLGGRPADNAVSYATYIARLLSEHGDSPGAVTTGKNMTWQAQFGVQTAGGDADYHIDVTRV